MDVATYHAWSFTEVIPGTFKRNKKIFRHHDYPIIGPLPSSGPKTPPLEGAGIKGPFIYLVLNKRGKICYIGKSQEKNLISRWVRPGEGGPVSHYWSHSTTTGGCVFKIAEGIRAGDGPYALRFSTLQELMPVYAKKLSISETLPEVQKLKAMEIGLINLYSPPWNRE